MGDDWWAYFAIVCHAMGKLAQQSPAGISWGANPGVQNSLEGFQLFFLSLLTHHHQVQTVCKLGPIFKI